MTDTTRPCVFITYRQHTLDEINAEPELRHYMHSDRHPFTAPRKTVRRMRQMLAMVDVEGIVRRPNVEVEGIEYFREAGQEHGPVTDGEFRFYATPTLDEDLYSELWETYDDWAQENGEYMYSRDHFTDRVSDAQGLVESLTTDGVVTVPDEVEDLASLARWALGEV